MPAALVQHSATKASVNTRQASPYAFPWKLGLGFAEAELRGP